MRRHAIHTLMQKPTEGNSTTSFGPATLCLLWLPFETLQSMVDELLHALTSAKLKFERENARPWSMHRAETVEYQGQILNSEGKLKAFGLNACMDGDPETNAKFAAAWRAFRANRHQLTARHLPRIPRWHRRKLVASPMLGASRQARCLMYRMVKVMFGTRPKCTEPWLEWTRKSIHDARACVGNPCTRNISGCNMAKCGTTGSAEIVMFSYPR